MTSLRFFGSEASAICPIQEVEKDHTRDETRQQGRIRVAEHAAQKARRHGAKKAADHEACKGRDRGRYKNRPHLLGHGQALRVQMGILYRRMRFCDRPEQQARDGDEGEMDQVGRDQWPGQNGHDRSADDRPHPQPSHIGDGREDAPRAVMPLGREFGHGDRGGGGEDPGREALQHAGHEDQRKTIGQHEGKRCQRRADKAAEKQRFAPDLVRPWAGAEKRRDHAASVDGEDHCDDEGREAVGRDIGRVERRRNRGTGHDGKKGEGARDHGAPTGGLVCRCHADVPELYWQQTQRPPSCSAWGAVRCRICAIFPYPMRSEAKAPAAAGNTTVLSPLRKTRLWTWACTARERTCASTSRPSET